MLRLEGLGDADLKSFLESINTIKRHPDILFMAETLDRKRASITSKKTQIVRPRPSRSMKASSMKNPSIRKVRQHSRRLLRQPEPETRETSSADRQWHTRPSAQVPYQNSHSEAASTESQPYAEDSIMMKGPPGFEYDGTFNTPVGNKSSFAGGNYRIDLDDMDGAPSPLEFSTF